MVLQFEAPISEARDVERSPIPALEPETEERPAALDGRSSQEVLKEAQRLLLQILSILNDPNCAKRSTAAGSFRLARGHALTLLDHLTSMADSPSASVVGARIAPTNEEATEPLADKRNAMGTPEKLSKDAIETFIAAHAGWKCDGDALTKTYSFEHYGAAIAFAVHVGFAADKRDHHPDMHISWGKVEVRWTTHDAGGISALDAEMAKQVDLVYRR